MKRKSEILKFEPQQWKLEVGNITFWVRYESGVGYYLSFGSGEWEHDFIYVRNPFKTIGDVEIYILKTFRIDTSFSS